MALEVSYGPSAQAVRVAGREGRAYAPGPEGPGYDADERSPAVITRHAGGMHHLVASDTMEVEQLLEIAESMY